MGLRKRDTKWEKSGWQGALGGVRVAFLGACTQIEMEAAKTRFGAPPNQTFLRQIHSSRVVQGRGGPCGEGDALITEESDLLLEIVTADCVPVLLTTGKTIAAVHAGWRGMAANILENTLEAFENPVVKAWIGPAIGGCCYEVSEEVAEAVTREPWEEDVVRQPAGGRPYLDLGLVARHRLQERGVREVEVIGPCTQCSGGNLHSYRRDGKKAGRNRSWIWLREETGFEASLSFVQHSSK